MVSVVGLNGLSCNGWKATRLTVPLLSDVMVSTFNCLAGLSSGPITIQPLYQWFKHSYKNNLSSLCWRYKSFVKVDSKRSEEKSLNAMDSVVRCCSVKAIELNVSKYLAFTYSQGSCGIFFSVHKIGDTNLKGVDRIINLGVIMTPSLSPFEHILHVTAKAGSSIYSGIHLPYHKRLHVPMDARCIIQYGSVWP